MTYFSIEMESPLRGKERHIFYRDGEGWISFPDVESNDGPERAAYLKWVAEGNTPEPWNPAP